jgi:hypothetical protein
MMTTQRTIQQRGSFRIPIISDEMPSYGSPQTHNTIHRERGKLVLIQQTIDSTMCNTTCSFDDASFLTDEPAAMIETTESAFAVCVEEEEEEESLEGVGKLIQDLAHSDNAKVNAALDALSLDLGKDKEKCDTVTAWGGCAALVRLMKDRLKKAMKKIPQCDQVTESNELPELRTLCKTLCVITNVSFYTERVRVAMVTVGGVEAVVKVMKTFPKCQALQWRGCGALLNLTPNNYTGKAKVIESNGIEVLLAAINNHLGSPDVCRKACWALVNNMNGSKENTELLIFLGGGAAVAKVRRKWRNNDLVQTQVRKLAGLFGAEMKAWVDEK